VIRRGPVELAISTGGLAPALAGLVREALEALLPEDLARWIDVATAARADWKRNGTPMSERRPLLLRALDRVYNLKITGDVAEPRPARSGNGSVPPPGEAT
jgi:siroheme synthase-like protein